MSYAEAAGGEEFQPTVQDLSSELESCDDRVKSMRDIVNSIEAVLTTHDCQNEYFHAPGDDEMLSEVEPGLTPALEKCQASWTIFEAALRTLETDVNALVDQWDKLREPRVQALWDAKIKEENALKRHSYPKKRATRRYRK